MSDTGRLPTSSDAQNIGARAEKCFGALCPESWRLNNVGGTGDFGIDYLIQTLENNQVSDTFKVQLKGTTVPALNSEGTHFSIQLKASTIRYYARFTEPILLVLCDLSVDPVAIKCRLYHVWIHDELRRVGARDLPDEQLFVNVHVPKANLLDWEANLSADLSQFRALANIGATLDMTLEKRAPSLDSGARAALLEKLPNGFSARGIALMESLAEDPVTVWPDRPVGSMAWFLFEAERHLNAGGLAKAEELLALASTKLETAVSLEVAEYWHIKGRGHLANLSREDASAAFESAIAAEPNQPKYLAAWAETRLAIDFSIDGPNNFSHVFARLKSPAPAIMAVKARLLAAEKRYVEAEAILDVLAGPESLTAKAVIHTMRSQHRQALEACEIGLSIPNIKDSARLQFMVLKVRAQFNLAIGADPAAENRQTRMPLTGWANTNLSLLLDAWDGMKSTTDGLRAMGTPANIEYVADVLCATASILERESDALSILCEAAEKRPGLLMLHAAVESLAAQTGDIELALSANARQSQNSTTKLRRCSLLHMAKRDADCVSFFESNLQDFDRTDPMFGEALTLALTSADRLIKSDLVKAWLELFDSQPELVPRRAVWEYFSTVSKNKAKRLEALDALYASYEEYAKPVSIAVHLLHALNPHQRVEAEKILSVGALLMSERLLPLDDIFQLGQALTTMERWAELLSLAEDARNRYRDDKTLITMVALAFDRLGRTSEARSLLLPLVELGVTEPFVLGTHIDIATRCGFIEEAITAAELLVSSTSDRKTKIGHLRLLHNLVRAKSPSDPRAYDIAWRIGELTDMNDEADEGAFLTMLAVSQRPDKSDSTHAAEFQGRLKDYNARFPNSSVLRAATVPENATPDELLATVMSLLGETPEKMEARRLEEERFRSSGKYVPFAWKPRIYVSEAADLPHLWELSKAARGGDARMDLPMILGEWRAVPSEEMRDRVPLLDLLSLLVAHDLNLLELLFQLFNKVAVSQRTLIDLGKQVDPHFGSPVQDKCRAIQAVLQQNFDRLLQPRVNRTDMEVEDSETLSISEELKALSRQSPFLLYSDDALFRIFCREESEDFQSICTLDVLSAMESQGLQTTAQVAEKVGILCSWGVGVAIEHRWQLAVLPQNLSQAETVTAGIELLRKATPCISIFNGMWGRANVTYPELLAHAVGLLSPMLRDRNLTEVAIASLMAIWHDMAIRSPDSPNDDLASLAILMSNAALSLATPAPYLSPRLWHVYLHLVAYAKGQPLDEESLVEAVSMAACVAANNDLNPQNFRRGALGTFLSKGLGYRVTETNLFRKSYKLWRIALAKEKGIGTPVFNHGPSTRTGPEYWYRWGKGNEATTVRWSKLDRGYSAPSVLLPENSV